MPQEQQMPLRRLHPSSLPAGRPETTLLPPPLHLPRRTCPSPGAVPARRLRSHRRPRQRRRRWCLATRGPRSPLVSTAWSPH